MISDQFHLYYFALKISKQLHYRVKMFHNWRCRRQNRSEGGQSGIYNTKLNPNQAHSHNKETFAFKMCSLWLLTAQT